MTSRVPYGQGTRMLALSDLCEWLNITERHARKLVERGAIPYRKVGHLLRFAEQEVEEWSRPSPRRPRHSEEHSRRVLSAIPRPRTVPALPKSLIEPEDGHAQKRAS
jgi:excisionase family DNA binding protein